MRRTSDSCSICYVTTADISLRFLLLQQMRYMQRAGFAVRAVSSMGPYVEEVRKAGVDVDTVPIARAVSPVADLCSIARLVHVFRKRRPDIVHTHTPKAGILGRVAARIAGVPLVVHTDFGAYLSTVPRPLRRLCEWTEHAAARLCDASLYEDPAAYAQSVNSGLSPAATSSWIGGGVDVSFFRRECVDNAARQAALDRAGFTDADVVIGCVARMVREKGVLDLLDAVRIVARGNPRVRLLLVGPADEPGRGGVDICREIAERGLSRITAYVGVQMDVRPWYAAMSIFALPTHRDSWPRSPMEASAMGLPLVVSNLEGLAMAVRDGQNGAVVGVGDVAGLAAALGAMAAPSFDRVAAAQASRALAQAMFDEERVFERVRRLYEGLVDAKTIRRRRPRCAGEKG